MSYKNSHVLALGNPYNAHKNCIICNVKHRHYSGLNYLHKNFGKKRLCPCCHNTHIIGFKEQEVNFVFLGTSSFHLAHQDLVFNQCMTFETVCGGKIKTLQALYEKFIAPVKWARVHVIVSAGLNDFHRSTLEVMKSDFLNFKNTIAKTDLHTVNFGSLLKAPKLYIDFNKKLKKNQINYKNLNKYEELNSYLKKLNVNEKQIDISKFGYSPKKKSLRLKYGKWREYNEHIESIERCLHLNNKHQRIALKSLVNQLWYDFYDCANVTGIVKNRALMKKQTYLEKTTLDEAI